jgi:hypothetical protein
VGVLERFFNRKDRKNGRVTTCRSHSTVRILRDEEELREALQRAAAFSQVTAECLRSHAVRHEARTHPIVAH